MENDRKRGGGNAAAMIMIAAFVTYVVFPHAFILPIMLATGKKEPPAHFQAALKIFFAPLQFLYNHVPAYAWLIDRESDLVGIYER